MPINMQTFGLPLARIQSQNENQVNNVFNYVIFLDDWIRICFHQFNRCATLIYGLIKTIYYLNFCRYLFKSKLNWMYTTSTRQYQFSALGRWYKLANKNSMNNWTWCSSSLSNIHNYSNMFYLCISLHED